MEMISFSVLALKYYTISPAPIPYRYHTNHHRPNQQQCTFFKQNRTKNRTIISPSGPQCTPGIVDNYTMDWEENVQIGITSSIVCRRFSLFARIKEAVTHPDRTDMVFQLHKGLDNSYFMKYFNHTLTDQPVWFHPKVIPINCNIIAMGKLSKPCFGGYFMISHNILHQVVEGVEFINMVQDVIARQYPSYYYFGGYTTPGSQLRNNSIHHSHHWYIAIEATHGVVMERNIAFQAHSHCFIPVNGIKINNQFISNIVLHFLPPSALPQ